MGLFKYIRSFAEILGVRAFRNTLTSKDAIVFPVRGSRKQSLLLSLLVFVRHGPRLGPILV